MVATELVRLDPVVCANCNFDSAGGTAVACPYLIAHSQAGHATAARIAPASVARRRRSGEPGPPGSAFRGSIFGFGQGITGRQEHYALIGRRVMTIECQPQISSEIFFESLPRVGLTNTAALRSALSWAIRLSALARRFRSGSSERNSVWTVPSS